MQTFKFLTLALSFVFFSCTTEETSENTIQSFCILKTACEEVIFEDTSKLSVTSTKSGEVYNIVVTNTEGEIVYEKECALGGEISLKCTSESETTM